MRTGEAHKVGPSGQQDGIHMVRLGDIAHRHGRQSGLVADAVRKRGLEHAAIDGPRLDTGLAGRDVDDIGPGGGEHLRDLHCLGRGHALCAHPVGCRDANRHGSVGGPGGAHRTEHLQRIAHAVVQRPAVFIRSYIRFWRYK